MYLLRHISTECKGIACLILHVYLVLHVKVLGREVLQSASVPAARRVRASGDYILSKVGWSKGW